MDWFTKTINGFVNDIKEFIKSKMKGNGEGGVYTSVPYTTIFIGNFGLKALLCNAEVH